MLLNLTSTSKAFLWESALASSESIPLYPNPYRGFGGDSALGACTGSGLGLANDYGFTNTDSTYLGTGASPPFSAFPQPGLTPSSSLEFDSALHKESRRSCG